MFCDDKKGTNSKNVDWKQNRAVFFARKREKHGIHLKVTVSLQE